MKEDATRAPGPLTPKMSLDDGGVAVLGPQETVGGQRDTSTVSHAAAGPSSGVVEQFLVPTTGVRRKELLRAITTCADNNG